MSQSGKRAASGKPIVQKITGAILALVLAAGTNLVLTTTPANATTETFPANGLNFSSTTDRLREAAVGDSFLYEDIAPGDIDARVTVHALDGAQSRSYSQFVIRWADPNPTANGFEYRWSTKTGSRIDSDYAYSGTIANASPSAVRNQTVNVQGWTPAVMDLRVEARSKAAGMDWEGIDDERVCSPDVDAVEEWSDLEEPGDYGPFSEADLACYTLLRNDDRLEIGDEYSDSDTLNRFIQAEMRNKVSGNFGVHTLKIEFLKSGQPATFSTLRVNAYDIDNSQYIEFYNIKDSQLTENSIVSRSAIGGNPNDVRFSASSTNASLSPSGTAVHSWGEARVQVNFEMVSTMLVTMGVSGSGSQQLDFSTGFNWVNSQGVEIQAPAPTVFTPTSNPTPPAGSTPQVAVLDVNPTNITVASEIITILGANLDRVDSVWVGGVNVPIMTVGKNRLQIRAPKGLSGLVDLELKSSLNNVLLTKKLNFGGTVAAGTRKETLIVGGFAHNSRVLTPRMKARIDRWLAKHSDLSTLTCTGFTSLPRRTSDVALSTNRGKTACAYSERKRAGIESSVSQGIEDPRPGSNVRRVRLVLTP